MTQKPTKDAARPPQPNPAMPPEGRGWTPIRKNAVNRRNQRKQSFFPVATVLMLTTKQDLNTAYSSGTLLLPGSGLAALFAFGRRFSSLA
jgi:hypothetical protein